jgi:uncharacterized membrane protein
MTTSLARPEPTERGRPWESWRRARRLSTASLLTAAVAVGVALRLVQYLGNRSLWLDEILLSESFINRSLAQLARLPLDEGQVAPLGFVELERLQVALFGHGERALRFWPFVASIAGLVLFAGLARRVIPEMAAGATLLFAVSPPLVYYTAEVKPYGLDVLFAVVLALAAITLVEKDVTPARWWQVAVIGMVAPWLSLTAVFALAAAALIVVAHASARDWRRAAALAIAWGASAGASLLDVRRRMDSDTAAYMHQYWAAGFFPFPPRSLHDLKWPVHFARSLLEEVFAFPVALLLVALATVGALYMIRRRRSAALATLLPLVFALGASALHAYPLEGRLALFLAPLAILAVASAIGLVSRAPRFGSPAAVATLLALVVAPILAFARNPRGAREDLRPVMAQLATRLRSGDAIFVYCGTEVPFQYYAARYHIPVADVSFGTCEHARLDRDLGLPRVWIVASHEFGWGSPLESPESFANYVGTIGHPVDSIVATGAWARLYDLSDSPPRSGPSEGPRS